MIEALGSIAPGRPLREGLDRILQANMGALIVVGDGPEVLSICSGGFLLDAEFSPPRLSELAKMDGAIILARGRQPDRPGQRSSRAEPHRGDLRDRDPPPDRGAGGPLDRRGGHHGLRGPLGHIRVQGRAAKRPSCPWNGSWPGPTRPSRRWRAIGTASTW